MRRFQFRRILLCATAGALIGGALALSAPVSQLALASTTLAQTSEILRERQSQQQNQIAPADTGRLNLSQLLDPDRADRPCDQPSANCPSKWVFTIWRLLMSLVNVGVVLLIIVIALATILHWNIDTYGFKKALPTLVIAIILANFSLLIVRGLVDVASILTTTLAGDPRELSQGLITALFGGVSALGLGAGIIGFPLVLLFFPTTITSILLLLLAAIVLVFIPAIFLGVMYFLLWIRVTIVLVFAAVSPLAFAALALPATQPWFKRWWSTVLNWVFMAPVVFLLFRIASEVGKFANYSNANAGFINTFIPYFIALGVLFLSVQVPFKMGGAIMATWGRLGNYMIGNRPGGWGRKIVEPFTEAGRLQREARYAKLSPTAYLQRAAEMQLETAKIGAQSAWAGTERRNRRFFGRGTELQRRRFQEDIMRLEEQQKRNVVDAAVQDPKLEDRLAATAVATKVLTDRIEQASKDRIDTLATLQWYLHGNDVRKIEDPVEWRRIRTLVETRIREEAQTVTNFFSTEGLRANLELDEYTHPAGRRARWSEIQDADGTNYFITKEGTQAFLRNDKKHLWLNAITDQATLEELGVLKEGEADSEAARNRYKARINREIEQFLLGLHGKLRNPNDQDHIPALQLAARLARDTGQILPPIAGGATSWDQIIHVPQDEDRKRLRAMVRQVAAVETMGKAQRPGRNLYNLYAEAGPTESVSGGAAGPAGFGGGRGGAVTLDEATIGRLTQYEKLFLTQNKQQTQRLLEGLSGRQHTELVEYHDVIRSGMYANARQIMNKLNVPVDVMSDLKGKPAEQALRVIANIDPKQGIGALKDQLAKEVSSGFSQVNIPATVNVQELKSQASSVIQGLENMDTILLKDRYDEVKKIADTLRTDPARAKKAQEQIREPVAAIASTALNVDPSTGQSPPPTAQQIAGAIEALKKASLITEVQARDYEQAKTDPEARAKFLETLATITRAVNIAAQHGQEGQEKFYDAIWDAVHEQAKTIGKPLPPQ